MTKARKLEQESFQETAYSQQQTARDLYTQQELLFSEDISQQLRELGEDYQANPVALGRKTGEKNEPIGLAALTIQYFGPNGELIPDNRELVFWNDKTGERDGYGVAIATAFKTPGAGDVFSSKHLLSCAQNVYDQLIKVKHQRFSELSQEDTLENVSITSERLNKIQQRITNISSPPVGLDRGTIRRTLQELNTWKSIQAVQKLLREYTDGSKAQIDDSTFLSQLVKDTDALNLIASNGIKPTSLQASLPAILLRA